MDSVHELLTHAPEIEGVLGYSFHDREHLLLALTHRSYLNEHQDTIEHNERLEYLGDAVLGLLVSDYLYRKFPHLREGELSSLRSMLVDANACMRFMQHFDLERFLLLGRGEKLNWQKGRESILADLFEAVIGAIYLDGGMGATEEFFFKHFTDDMEQIIQTPTQNWKAQLQDYCQREFQQIPQYDIISAEGPDHDKIFTIAVSIEGKKLTEGTGCSKKEAQANAAQKAMAKIEEETIGH